MFSFPSFFLHKSWGTVKTPLLSSSLGLLGILGLDREVQLRLRVSPSLGPNLTYSPLGLEKGLVWLNSVLFKIFVLYHNFNEISVLPTKIWGKSTDFILIHSLYIFKVYSLGFLIKYSKQNPLIKIHEENNEIYSRFAWILWISDPQNYSCIINLKFI